MRQKKMTAEDRILWGKVARSVEPLPGRMEELEAFETPYEERPEALPSRKVAGYGHVAPGFSGEEKTPGSGTPHRHHPIERPVRQKISKGRLPLEARIDLHGLVQSEAHAMLLAFLVQAHERGMRHVLVITGKGSSLGSDGALKRAVPLWFSKPEFRFLISGYEPASRNHGGEGALYVRLARRRGESL